MPQSGMASAISGELDEDGDDDSEHVESEDGRPAVRTHAPTAPAMPAPMMSPAPALAPAPVAPGSSGPGPLANQSEPAVAPSSTAGVSVTVPKKADEPVGFFAKLIAFFKGLFGGGKK